MKKNSLLIPITACLIILTLVVGAYADMLLKAPSNVYKGTYRDGSTFTVDANNNVTVPSDFVPDAFRAGFTIPVISGRSLTTVSTGTAITATAANIAGAGENTYIISGQTAATALTTPSATAMLAARADGSTSGWKVRLINLNTSSGTLTFTAGTNVTIASGATTTIGYYHDYIASFATPTITLTSAGTGTIWGQ